MAVVIHHRDPGLLPLTSSRRCAFGKNQQSFCKGRHLPSSPLTAMAAMGCANIKGPGTIKATSPRVRPWTEHGFRRRNAGCRSPYNPRLRNTVRNHAAFDPSGQWRAHARCRRTSPCSRKREPCWQISGKRPDFFNARIIVQVLAVDIGNDGDRRRQLQNDPSLSSASATNVSAAQTARWIRCWPVCRRSPSWDPVRPPPEGSVPSRWSWSCRGCRKRHGKFHL